MPRLLVVHHTPSPTLQEMIEAAVSGHGPTGRRRRGHYQAGPDRGRGRRARDRRLSARHPAAL